MSMRILIGLFLALFLTGNASAFDIVIPIHNGGSYATGLEGVETFESEDDLIRLSKAIDVYDVFDDASINTTWWFTDTAANGTVTESGTTIVLDNSGATGDGAMLGAAQAFDRTNPSRFRVKYKKATTTKSARLDLTRKTGEPTLIDAGTTIVYVKFDATGVLDINYWDSAGTRYYWTGSVWTTTSTTFGSYSANTYYTIRFESDGTSWWVEIRDANDVPINNTHITDPITWAATYAPAGDDDWFFLRGHTAAGWEEVNTIDYVDYEIDSYNSTSPATTGTWTALPAGTLDMSTARLVIFKDGEVQAATSTDVKLRYYANNGAASAWMTLSALRLESDITVTDTTNSVKVEAQYISDATYQSASEYKLEMDFSPTGGTGRRVIF